MTLVCRLLAEDRPADLEVARRWDDEAGVDRRIGWAEFRRDVESLEFRLARERAGAWVLLTEDAYAFAVGLFALWHAGHHAVLPPNRQPHSLAMLETRSAGVLSDRPEWFSDGKPLNPLRDGEVTVGPRLAPLDPDALSVELFTSGTTGDEKPVTKRIAHLEQEVVQLEECFGEMVGASTFFSTASHQHLYGLLFGVLWPLCSGRSFDAHHALHPGELVPRMREEAACVLASVPTSLKRLARHAGTPDLRDRCRAVFSSGGPLPAETAHAVGGAIGRVPIEVLGSTETGGIAWRTQHPDVFEPSWTPFPRVRIERDDESGVLRVSSPFVSADTREAGFATGDCIDLAADGRFRLGGRSDQIVKIGEKRLDLDRMASRLRGHEWVEDVALTTIEHGAEPRVAAVVVASQRGLEALGRGGRRAFSRDLRETLAGAWDPVVHPRHWRIVAELPENEQGKVTRRALDRLFESGALQSGGSDRPEVVEELRGADFIERTCVVPEDLACFAGHFPEFPVVPGVLQLDWAMDLASLLLGGPPVVEEIESFKLIAPLLPGAHFGLHVRVATVGTSTPDADAGAARMEFTFWSRGEKCAAGRMLLAQRRATSV